MSRLQLPKAVGSRQAVKTTPVETSEVPLLVLGFHSRDEQCETGKKESLVNFYSKSPLFNA